MCNPPAWRRGLMGGRSLYDPPDWWKRARWQSRHISVKTVPGSMPLGAFVNARIWIPRVPADIAEMGATAVANI